MIREQLKTIEVLKKTTQTHFSWQSVMAILRPWILKHNNIFKGYNKKFFIVNYEKKFAQIKPICI
jgi:hypothetical protein